MKIVIEWNQEIGEARMEPQSKAALEKLLADSARQKVLDVDLGDFLVDARFIIDQAYSAILKHEPRFDDFLTPSTDEEEAQVEARNEVIQ